MVLEIIFEAPYTQWDWKVGVYVAFIGIAGGAYLTGYVADLLSWRTATREHGRVARYGYLTGLGGLVVGPPILLSHLATPFRAMLLPLTMTNLDSWMAIGSYMLAGFGLGTFLMFAWTAFGKDRPHSAAVADGGDEEVAADGGRDIASDGGPAKAATGGQTSGGVRSIADTVGLLDRLDALSDYTRPSEKARLALGAFFAIFAAGTLLYSAMALGSGSTQRVPMWDKTFLVPVQIFGGLGAGLTVSVALAAVSERSVGRTVGNYALAAAGLLLISLLAVAATVVVLPGQSAAAAESIGNALTEHALLFIGIAVIGGLVLPILLLAGGALGQRNGALSPSAAMGSYTLAAVLVIAGKIALVMTYLVASEFTALPLPV